MPVVTRADVHVVSVEVTRTEQMSVIDEPTDRDISNAATTTAIKDVKTPFRSHIPSNCRKSVRDEVRSQAVTVRDCPFEKSKCPFLKAASELLSYEEISMLQ